MLLLFCLRDHKIIPVVNVKTTAFILPLISCWAIVYTMGAAILVDLYILSKMFEFKSTCKSLSKLL